MIFKYMTLKPKIDGFVDLYHGCSLIGLNYDLIKMLH